MTIKLLNGVNSIKLFRTLTSACPDRTGRYIYERVALPCSFRLNAPHRVRLTTVVQLNGPSTSSTFEIMDRLCSSRERNEMCTQIVCVHVFCA